MGVIIDSVFLKVLKTTPRTPSIIVHSRTYLHSLQLLPRCVDLDCIVSVLLLVDLLNYIAGSHDHLVYISELKMDVFSLNLALRSSLLWMETLTIFCLFRKLHIEDRDILVPVSSSMYF